MPNLVPFSCLWSSHLFQYLLIAFGILKTEKVKFFTQSSTKIVCSSIFNVEGCLASCLIFRPFLTLDS